MFEPLSLSTLEDNEHWVAVLKPNRMLTIPDRFNQQEPSVKKLLEQIYGRIFIVHRLDYETSGLLLVAKTEEAHRYLSLLFEERKIEKYYLGLVHGNPQPASGSIHASIAPHSSNHGRMIIDKRGKELHTDYELLEPFGRYSWLKFQLHTGRTHQIRIHLSHIGHPIVGDSVYGEDDKIYVSTLKPNFKLAKKEEAERPILARLALHAESLKFQDLDGTIKELHAGLPKDIEATLRQLRKWKSRPLKENRDGRLPEEKAQ